jgi:hypothetical protein
VSGPRSLVELEFFAAASVASWERFQRARIAFGEEGANVYPPTEGDRTERS